VRLILAALLLFPFRAAEATIVLDAVSHTNAQSNMLSFNHTCTGSNLMLTVQVGILTGSATVTSVTYGGVNLTLGVAHQDAGATLRNEIWFLANPATGTHNVVVNVSSSNRTTAGGLSYTGVNGTGATQSGDAAAGVALNMTLTSTVANSMIVGILNINARTDTSTPLAPTVIEWTDSNVPAVVGNGIVSDGYDHPDSGVGQNLISFSNVPPNAASSSALELIPFLSPTPTWTPTATQTATQTQTQSFTNSPTATLTPTPPVDICSGLPLVTCTSTPTGTVTPTISPSPTRTPTASPTRTNSPTITFTPTFTSTPTFTVTLTATPTWSPTLTSTPTLTVTNTFTFSPTSTVTPTNTPSFTPTPSFTASPTICILCSSTTTPSMTPTVTMTAVCVLYGDQTAQPTPAPMYGLCLFKPIHTTFTARCDYIRVYVSSGTGKLIAALYESSSFGQHLVAGSHWKDASPGWNTLNMSTRGFPAGDYWLAVEGSNTLANGSISPGPDLFMSTNWGYFPSLVAPKPEYVDNSIYSQFCSP
jgi:hypothetical protein